MPTGGQSHDSHDGSSAPSCIHSKGLDRLRCGKNDAVVGIVFTILGLIISLILIYLYIRRRSARKNRHEEDGTEMIRGATNRDPGLQTTDAISDGTANIGHAVTTSDTLAKERTQESTGQLSGVSSGMIRTAQLGLALQDPTIIDVPPSLASSRMASIVDAGESFHCEFYENGQWHGPGNRPCDPVDDDDNVEGGESSRGSNSGPPHDARCSCTRPGSPPVLYQGDVFFSSGSETVVDSDVPHQS